jgi:hypothetical protein
MGLYKRKWVRGLGITTLIALLMTCGVLFGPHLVKPKSEMDILRALPTYPGARDVDYRLAAKLADSDPVIAQLNVLTYRVNNPPKAVLQFYMERLARDGPDHQIGRARSLTIQKTENVLTGIQFEERPPWVRAQYRPVDCNIHVGAKDIERNGEKFTEVTVELSTRSVDTP